LIKPVAGAKKEDGSSGDVDSEGEAVVSTINPFGIMQEIAKGVYLEEVLCGKFDSQIRQEVCLIFEGS
jgi:hypothetical protein